MKPHPDIYRAAIEISGLSPQTALFIDDKLDNCRAAAALGILAIHFQSPTQLTERLAQFGV